MSINNFDTSSSGVNIELSIFMNECLAQSYYEEMVSKITLFGYDFYLFNTGEKYAFEEYTYKEFYRKNVWGISERFSYREFVEAFKINNGYQKWNKLTIESFESIVSYEMVDFDVNWRDRGFIVQDFLNNGYELTVTRGYSQGDAKYVVKRVDTCDSFVDNVFWDSPVYALLYLNSDEIDLTEYMSNLYDYDKSSLLEAVKDANWCTDIVYKFLSENLPLYVEY